MPILHKVNVKLILMMCLVLQTIVILGFCYSGGNYTVILVCRFLTGMFQVFINIVGPVWCDRYSPADRKTTWVTYQFCMQPCGMVSGYLLTALLISYEIDWSFIFIGQCICLIPVGIGILCTPIRYLNIVDEKSQNNSQNTNQTEESVDEDLFLAENNAMES